MWWEVLLKIEVKSQEEDVLKNFYIVLYYFMVVLMLVQDVDGCYCGMDKVIY